MDRTETLMRLTDEELRDVLARAEEIERAARRGDAWNAELAAVIGAAEEVGLSRHAVERALAGRLNLPATPPGQRHAVRRLPVLRADAHVAELGGVEGQWPSGVNDAGRWRVRRGNVDLGSSAR